MIATAVSEYSSPHSVRCIGFGGTSASLPPLSPDDSTLLFRLAPDALVRACVCACVRVRACACVAVCERVCGCVWAGGFPLSVAVLVAFPCARRVTEAARANVCYVEQDLPVHRVPDAVRRTQPVADPQVGNMKTNQVLAVLEHGQRYASQFSQASRTKQHFVVVLLVSARDLPSDPAVTAMLGKLSTTPLTVVMLGLGTGRSTFNASTGVAAQLAVPKGDSRDEGGNDQAGDGSESGGMGGGAGGAGAGTATAGGSPTSRARRGSTFARITSRRRREDTPLPMFREHDEYDPKQGAGTGRARSRTQATVQPPPEPERKLLRRRSSFALVTESRVRPHGQEGGSGSQGAGSSGTGDAAGSTSRDHDLAHSVLMVIPDHFVDYVDANGLVPELYGGGSGGTRSRAVAEGSSPSGAASSRNGSTPKMLGAAARAAAEASRLRRSSPASASMHTASLASVSGDSGAGAGSGVGSGGGVTAPSPGVSVTDLAVGEEAGLGLDMEDVRLVDGDGYATGDDSDDGAGGAVGAFSAAVKAPVEPPSIGGAPPVRLGGVNSGFSGAKIPTPPSPSPSPSTSSGRRGLKDRRAAAPRGIEVVAAHEAAGRASSPAHASPSPHSQALVPGSVRRLSRR